jgi:hypothetical protein
MTLSLSLPPLSLSLEVTPKPFNAFKVRRSLNRKTNQQAEGIKSVKHFYI